MQGESLIPVLYLLIALMISGRGLQYKYFCYPLRLKTELPFVFVDDLQILSTELQPRIVHALTVRFIQIVYPSVNAFTPN